MSESGKSVRPPLPKKSELTQVLSGHWGEFGGEGAYSVRFLQSAVAIGDLSKFTLVANIPNSESWPVRELFQRDIDEDRVSNSIIPYLKNPKTPKFFNPLTMALLPFSENGGVMKNLPAERKLERMEGEFNYIDYLAESYYRLVHCVDEAAYSSLHWNPKKVRLVAIDGQHRLSALQRMKAELDRNADDKHLAQVGFAKWSIPIVVAVPFPKKNEDEPDILTTVRKVFVTINTSAQIPTRSRRILLTDDSVTAVCVQEVLECLHEGREAPLEIIDWRSKNETERGGVESFCALFRVDELADIHSEYLVGEDEDQLITPGQATALWLEEKLATLKKKSGAAYWEPIREAYKETVLELVLAMLRDFKPFAEYGAYLKGLDENANDVRKQALSVMRFGVHYGDHASEAAIRADFKKLSDQVQSRRAEIPELLRMDIGARGLFSGASQAKRTYEAVHGQSVAWKKFAKWYVDGLNRALAAGWLEKESPHLRHLVVGASGETVMYRLSDVPRGLGAYVALTVCVLQKLKAGDWVESDYLGVLEDSYQRGFRKEVRSGIKEENPKASAEEINELVKDASAKKAAAQVRRLRKALGC